MHDHLRNHASKEEFEQAQRKSKTGPVMAIFHHVQAITLEVDFLVKVHFVKRLHWYAILSIVFHAVLFAAKMQIVLHRPTRIPCFLIFPG
jgi:hypothetical protein